MFSHEIAIFFPYTSAVDDISSTEPEIMKYISFAISPALYRYSSGANCKKLVFQFVVKYFVLASLVYLNFSKQYTDRI